MSTTVPYAAEAFKKDAEDLTRIAVEDGISVVQIRNLYDRARSKGAVDFEIYTKYQMARSDNRGRIILSREFGDKMLSLLSKYQKQELITVLKYAVMLYEYTKQHHQQQTFSPHSFEIVSNKPLTDNVKKRIEEVIKARTSTSGFTGLNIEMVDEYGREGLKIYVKLNRFYGDPKVLSVDLKNTLKAEVNELANTFFNVWIVKGLRR